MGDAGSEYGSKRIHKTRWGTVGRNDGSWTTLWRLGVQLCVRPLAGEAIDVLRDEDLCFRATVSAVGKQELELKVDTEQDAMSAPYYALTYKAFGMIDSEIASIETIQSLPKEWYAPFRD